MNGEKNHGNGLGIAIILSVVFWVCLGVGWMI